MAFFTVNSNQEINDMLAYNLYRSFQSAFETIKQNGGTLKDLEEICDSFIPIDDAHPDTIDTPIPDISECHGQVTIICKYGMIGVALTGFIEKNINIQSFVLADAYHAFYKDALTKQYYFHEMKEKYQLRDEVLENTEEVTKDPLMKFIEQEVPFRLSEIHGIENVDKDLVDFVTVELQNDTDVLFDYDGIDSFIEKQIESYGAEHGTKPLNALLNNVENKNTQDTKDKEITPQHLTR